jgi:hypothetical protein
MALAPALPEQQRLQVLMEQGQVALVLLAPERLVVAQPDELE